MISWFYNCRIIKLLHKINIMLIIKNMIKKENFKETLLTLNKEQDLFGENYKFIEWFDYDIWRRNDGGIISKADDRIYKSFRNILQKDARFNTYYDLVAVVSLSICPYPYSNSPFVGQVIRRPRYVKPNAKFLGETGFAGTIVCRDKKTGKILPVPKKWLYTSTRHCILPGQVSTSDLPGLANLIVDDVFCQDYDIYEKLIRIHVFERSK